MKQVKFSMNGYRYNVSCNLKELREAISNILEDVHEDDKAELIDKFDEVVSSVNGLNELSMEGVESFSNVSKEDNVPYLDEKLN